MRVLVIHGPNLNLLGTREPEVYGTITLDEINNMLVDLGKELGVEVEFFQSNSEGEIVGRIQEARGSCQAILINPGAYTHTSMTIPDAIVASGLPAVEVHLSNIFGREEHRRRSLTAGAAVGLVAGFGPESYMLGLRAATGLASTRKL